MKTHIIAAGILLLSIGCCYLAYSFDSSFVLWLGMIGSFILAILGVLAGRGEKDWLAILVFFTISMSVPSFFQTRSWGFVYPFADSSFDLTLSNLIRESGRWYPGMGFDVIIGYSYYPVLHILTAITSDLTGMDTAFFARIFPFLAEPLVVIFFYLSLRKIISKEAAIWSSLIYNLIGSFHFWEYFIREFIALVFFSICIYVVFRMYRNRESRNGFFIIGIIAVIMTAISHHWTSYNLVLMLIVLSILPVAYYKLHAKFVSLRMHSICQTLPGNQNLVVPSFLKITLVVTLTWALYVAYIVFSIHAQQFVTFLVQLTTFSSGFVAHSMTGLGLQSKILLYFGYALLGLLGLVELVRQFFKRQKTYNESILESWFVFCAVYILVTTFLLPSGAQWWVISWRSWVFAFFGLAPLVATSIVKARLWKGSSKFIFRFKGLCHAKNFAPFILIFPLISAVLMAPPEILRPGYPHAEDSFYYTAKWVGVHVSGKIAIDPWAATTIIPYGRTLESDFLKWPGGSDQFINAIYTPGSSNNVTFSWPVIIFNDRITEWLPTASNSSVRLDQSYNRIYDSRSLTTFKASYVQGS